MMDSTPIFPELVLVMRLRLMLPDAGQALLVHLC
jgi:hypothetical protein